MLRGALVGIIALVALATATIICLIAAAFALFAALTPALGPAGAAAIVAVASLLFVMLAVILTLVATRPKQSDPDDGLIERLFDIARERPLIAVGAAIAAGVLAIRNPALIATIVAVFMEGRKSKD